MWDLMDGNGDVLISEMSGQSNVSTAWSHSFLESETGKLRVE
jgi:hypothetical protein